MLIGATIVCAVVFMFVLAVALRSRGRRAPSRTDGRGSLGVMLVGGALIPLVVLVALFVLILQTLPSTAQPKPGLAQETIRVVGHQFFWEVRYPDHHFTTANEIHIPAGQI